MGIPRNGSCLCTGRMPSSIVGKQVKHKSFGCGEITAIEGTSIAVQFDKVGIKKMGYEFCMKKKLLEFI